jgi:hypothetical protein
MFELVAESIASPETLVWGQKKIASPPWSAITYGWTAPLAIFRDP